MGWGAGDNDEDFGTFRAIKRRNSARWDSEAAVAVRPALMAVLVCLELFVDAFKNQVQKMSHGGGQEERKVVSKSTHTKTSTCNGVKTVVKTTKIKYSDGT